MRITTFCFLKMILIALFGIGEIAAEGMINREQADSIYYINTQEDFDQWSNYVFPAGSKVLFPAGKIFKGQFILRGSGTAAFPNLAAAYNTETGEALREWTDQKPVIKGEGKVTAALKLSNGSFWEINNIEVTNTDGTDKEQGEIVGILVEARNIGLSQDITITNCYVHHVNGKVGGKKTGGIHVNVEGNSNITKYQNVTIENNIVSRVGGVGISNQSSFGNILSDEYYPWTGYVIRGNRVEYTGRNGIIVRYSKGSLVEYNIAAYNSLYDVGHSIFNFNTIDCTVQYNEAYGNTSNDLGEIDRGGFDCDFNARNTIYQYNYSHDNHWFMAIQERNLNHNVIIRYNISENERLGAYMYGFPEYDDLRGLEIYNNTHFFGKGTGTKMFMAIRKDRIPTQTKFYNNIFYFEDPAEWVFDPDSTCILSNNLFYNVSPKGKKVIIEKPLFVNPGQGGVDIDMTDPDRLSGYKLQPGSPAIDAGIAVSSFGGTGFGGNINGDFAGNMVPSGSVPDLGAFERQYKGLSVLLKVKDVKGKPAENAIVSIEGFPDFVLDETGMLHLKDIDYNGVLPAIITLDEYPPKQVSVDPFVCDTLLVQLSNAQNKLKIKLKDQYGLVVSGATIALAGIDTLRSDDGGEVMFDLVTSSEMLYLHGWKDGYRDAFIQTPCIEDMTLEMVIYERWAGFHFLNVQGNDIPGVSIITDNFGKAMSDDEGIARIPNVNLGDTIYYSISKAGHIPIDGQQVIPEQSMISTIYLSPVIVNFRILNEELESLPGASVLFMDQLKYANESGVVQFNYVPIGDTLEFSVYHSGYVTYRDVSIIAVSGETIFVQMYKPSQVDVLFSITDYTGNLLQNANVYVEGYGTAITDIEGKALFHEVETAEDIFYQVSCEGYADTSGYFTVTNKDEEIGVVLKTLSTGLISLHKQLSSYLELIPNPAKDYVHVHTKPAKGILSLIDLSGRVVFNIDLKNAQIRINTGALQAGNYLVRHTDEKSRIIQSKILHVVK